MIMLKFALFLRTGNALLLIHSNAFYIIFKQVYYAINLSQLLYEDDGVL